jgi:hypothetical protein
MEERARHVVSTLAAYATNWQHATMLAALLAVAIMTAFVAKRMIKDGSKKLSAAGTLITVIIVVGTTIDGALKFADLLGAHGVERLFPAAVFESVMLAIYQRARAYSKTHNGPGHWGLRLYIVGVLDGCIIAMAASSVPMAIFRFTMPIIAVWLLNMELEPLEKPAGLKTRWRYTPSVIGMKLGLLRAVDGDVEAGDDEREAIVRRMVRHGAGSNGFLTGRYHTWRLRKAYMSGGHDIECLTDAVSRAANLAVLGDLFDEDQTKAGRAIAQLSATATNHAIMATATKRPPATGHAATAKQPATATTQPATATKRPPATGHAATAKQPATATTQPATDGHDGHAATAKQPATATTQPATDGHGHVNGHQPATATTQPATATNGQPATAINGHGHGDSRPRPPMATATRMDIIRVPSATGAAMADALARRIPNPTALAMLRSGSAVGEPTRANDLVTSIPGVSSRTARRWVSIFNESGDHHAD